MKVNYFIPDFNQEFYSSVHWNILNEVWVHEVCDYDKGYYYNEGDNYYPLHQDVEDYDEIDWQSWMYYNN